jgi:hypothetical protein
MRKKSVLFGMLLSCLLASCEYGSNTITLESNSAPLTFKLHGSGEVQWIWIQGPYQNNGEPAPKVYPEGVIWKIVPPGGRFVPMKEVPPITYAELPAGWEQLTPQAGSPPPLLEGYVYHVDVVLVRGGAPTLCVSVKGGQIQPYTHDMQTSPCK